MNGSDDDRDLADVFRDATAGAPPPRFDHADVLRASDRITTRRRTVLRGGVAALVVLAGLGGVGGAVALQGRGATTGSAASAPVAGDSAGGAAREGQPVPMVAPSGAASTPVGPGTGACANRQDPALRTLVEHVLPDVADAPGAATSHVCLPGSERYLSVEYRGEVLTVAYLPPGTTVSVTPGVLSATTASGGTVLVPAAYPQLLSYLAPRL